MLILLYIILNGTTGWPVALETMKTSGWKGGAKIPDPYMVGGKSFHLLEGCVNRHAPIQKLNQKEQKRNQKPWITNETLKRIKHRNNLFAQRKNNPSDENIKRTYVLFRNAINRDIKAAKKSYWATYFDQSKNDMKKTWERYYANSKH